MIFPLDLIKPEIFQFYLSSFASLRTGKSGHRDLSFFFFFLVFSFFFFFCNIESDSIKMIALFSNIWQSFDLSNVDSTPISNPRFQPINILSSNERKGRRRRRGVSLRCHHRLNPLDIFRRSILLRFHGHDLWPLYIYISRCSILFSKEIGDFKIGNSSTERFEKNAPTLSRLNDNEVKDLAG